MASQIKGVNSIRRKLQRMPDHITEPVKKTLERGAMVIHADTLTHIRVDEGDLAASLHKAKRSNGFRWIVGWWKKGNIKNWRSGGWRAHFEEFGTSKTSANPVLGPAFRKNEKWLVGQVKAAVNRALRQASKL